MMNRYKTVFYFNLEEILEAESISVYGENNPWETYFKKYLPYAPIYTSTTPSILKEHIAKLMDMVLARYRKEYIAVLDYDMAETEDKKEVCLKLVNILVQTYDKYIALIPAAEAVQNDPLKRVEVETTGKVGFNDTPQTGGAFEDDGHRSNLTESSSISSSDISTPVERYRELQEKFNSIMFQWVKEFDRLFIEEANI